MRKCEVYGCDRPHRSKGLCGLHYYRLRVHGDPEATPLSTKKGDVIEYLKSFVVPYDKDDCLPWPYAKRSGYGCLTVNGKQIGAHQLVCRLVHGDAPTDKHEVAHSCGNGRLGCVNPNHLRWATRAENHADKNIHGTMVRGEKMHMARLTPDIVRGIRKGCETKMQKDVAVEFGVHKTQVSQIMRRKTWAWVE